ncbi:transcriptional regulator BetI [Roseovarius sp. EL26]|uniref:choline-binding transcriptional repressor BetI n=1 Tax=Roseovarius sp. EL26 TaxID=2126672 RepID=UPI000EA003E1|nr:transcriptional regulator BetI [Roseovarius sp. EL26]
MKRKTIRDIRNEELIEAAISAIHSNGFLSVTMTEIAKEAGATAASISYYFGSKDKLMDTTMRRLLSLLRERSLHCLAQAKTPEERLYAIIDANFDDSLFTKEKCSVWMQFWASAPYVPSLARLHRINRLRVQSNVRRELRSLVPDELLEPVRESVQAYMDGIWIETAQSDKPVDPAAARDTARQVVATLIEGALAGNTPK